MNKRTSRDEGRLFIDTAREIIDEIEEPRDWKRHDPKKHAAGRPLTYTFREMLLILLLMVYKERSAGRIEAHLNNNPHLLKELGLKKAPGKSTMQRACAGMGIGTPVRMNDMIIAKFKKARRSTKEEPGDRLLWPRDKEEPVVLAQDAYQFIEKKRLQEAPSRMRMHAYKREAGLKVLTYNVRQLIRYRIRLELQIREQAVNSCAIPKF